MSSRFIPEVETVLQAAGWFPGRRVSEEVIQKLDEMRPLFPAVRRVAVEFAGLYFEANGDTVYRGPDGEVLKGANSEILWNPHFRSSFCIDPIAAFIDYGDYEHQEYEGICGCKARFIGFQSYYNVLGFPQMVSGHDHILMDERGRLFLVDYVHTLLGETIEQALHNLILKTGMQWWDLEKDAPQRDSLD
jgi:hypothetical protein